MYMSCYSADHRNRFPHKKRSSQRPSVSDSALGHSRTGTLPQSDPQLHERCQLCSYGVRCIKKEHFGQPEDLE